MFHRFLPTDSLWRDRTFVLFWTARSASIVGSVITAIVMPILVFRLTGSPLQTALLGAFQVVPYLAFGLFAGALADRVNRRTLMITCDVINAALLASIPIAAALGVLTVTQIYAVSLLSMTAFVWFDAANFGALPAIVGRERLVAANSAIWSTATLIEIVGPAVGGLLASTIGPAAAISIDALSFAISAVALALVPRAFSLTKDEGRRANDTPTSDVRRLSFVVRQIGADIREGLHFLWNHRLVRTMTLLGFGNSFTGGAALSLLLVYAVRGLGIAEDDSRIGLLFSATAIGGLLASMLLPRLTKNYPVGRITLLGMFGSLLLLIGVALAPNVAFAIDLLLAWQMCYTLVIINGISIRQMVTPDHLQSRVNTTTRMIAWGGTPFGAALGGLVAEFVDIRTTYIVMAVGVTLSVLLGWFSPLREREIAPTQEAEALS
jgi:MFS family permease